MGIIGVWREVCRCVLISVGSAWRDVVKVWEIKRGGSASVLL